VATPARDRLAAVRCGDRQGSGYLLTPWLVLTAARVVAGGAAIRVTVPGRPAAVTGERVWQRYDEQSGADAALLALETPGEGAAGRESAHLDGALDTPGTPDTLAAGFSRATDPRERWAKITSLAPIPGCRAAGFRAVQHAAAARTDPARITRPAAGRGTEQGTELITCTYRPGAGLFSGRDLLTTDGAPPWAGLSGAAVFAGAALLGVITGDQRGRRYGRVTVMPVQLLRRDPGFHGAVNELGYELPPLSGPPGQLTGEAAAGEARYTGYVAHRHGTALRTLGIDPLDGRGAVRPTAPGSAGAIPAERALGAHERVLLRGAPGPGRTALVQRLAVVAARQEPGEHTRYLRGLVPYVLPLRTVGRRERLPAPAEFLSAVDIPLSPPPGWTEGVLRDGRALVLVDGLDEIDGPARARVGAWLRGLLAAWPGNRWLVTAGPSAPEAGWLADQGFTELTLSRSLSPTLT
jgi:NACHT domain